MGVLNRGSRDKSGAGERADHVEATAEAGEWQGEGDWGKGRLGLGMGVEIIVEPVNWGA